MPTQSDCQCACGHCSVISKELHQPFHELFLQKMCCWLLYFVHVMSQDICHPPRTPALSVDTGHTGRHLWPTTQPLIHCLSLSGDLVGQAQKVWCSLLLLPRCPYTVCLTVLTLDWPTHVLVLIKGEQGQRSLQLADVEGQLKLS